MNKLMYAVFGGLAGFTVGLVGMFVYISMFPMPTTNPGTAVISQPYEETVIAKTDRPPTAIQTAEPTGVTPKDKPDTARLEPSANTPAPVRSSPSAATGFGIDLGAAPTFGELTLRFAEIAATNAEMLLDQLELRAILSETTNGQEARLMIGPFETLEEAQTTCANIALPADIQCSARKFEGELLER
jgi:hypothetical protein